MNKIIRKSIRILFWATPVTVILYTGVRCFPLENPELDFWGALYYTLRLFILEHDLPAFPDLWQLRVIYFIAPLVAVSAVWRAVVYLFRFSPNLRIRLISDHVVVCGVGGNGKSLVAMLKEKKIPVVGVDMGPREAFEDWAADNRIPMVYGDFLTRTTLMRAGANRARSIIFAAGDDLLNIEGAVRTYAWMQTTDSGIQLIWTHVADEKLAGAARQALRTRGTVGIRIFDIYRIAALKMVEQYFPLEISARMTDIFILGFGKFGKDLFEVLATATGSHAMRTYHIVDKEDHSEMVAQFAADLGIPDNVCFSRSDIKTLTLTNGRSKAYFLCTDDDIGNLSVALNLSSAKENALILVRMANWPMPAIEAHFCKTRGLNFVCINELVKHGLEELAGVFKPATPADLKRLSDN